MNSIKTRDVTEFVDFNSPDDECLPVTRCLCGKEFPIWDFVISIYPDMADGCSNCGKKLYFRNSVRVFEVLD